MSAREFSRMPDDGQPKELVRGRIMVMNLPTPRHGRRCFRVARLFSDHAESNKLGRIFTNDSGILTEQDPDTVRGADVAYYSFERLPQGTIPEGYLDVKPELVIEVRSQSDRMNKLLAKVAEYLAAGVSVVIIVDFARRTINVFTGDEAMQTLNESDVLEVPTIFPGWRLPVSKFFEEE
jgi:Uma2 family endonuclease